MTTVQASASVGLPVPIRDRPHWRVRIRPDEFVAERIKSTAQCWTVVNAAAVQLRGWDYPHVDHEYQTRGNDWIASWIDWERHIEYWRFFQSGQFVHLFGFREDFDKASTIARVRSSHFVHPPDSEILGVNDFLDILFTLTEVHEFASGLAVEGVLGATCHVELSMHGMRNRLLYSLDPSRAWFGRYRADIDTLSRPPAMLTTVDLLSRSADEALQAALWFYDRFGWDDPPIDLLRREQAAFLSRR